VRTSALAQALFAGLLQRLGAQHRNEAMIEAGKRLAKRIISDEAEGAAPIQRPSAACELARDQTTKWPAAAQAVIDDQDKIAGSRRLGQGPGVEVTWLTDKTNCGRSR